MPASPHLDDGLTGRAPHTANLRSPTHGERSLADLLRPNDGVDRRRVGVFCDDHPATYVSAPTGRPRRRQTS